MCECESLKMYEYYDTAVGGLALAITFLASLLFFALCYIFGVGSVMVFCILFSLIFKCAFLYFRERFMKNLNNILTQCHDYEIRNNSIKLIKVFGTELYDTKDRSLGILRDLINAKTKDGVHIEITFLDNEEVVRNYLESNSIYDIEINLYCVSKFCTFYFSGNEKKIVGFNLNRVHNLYEEINEKLCM